MSRHFLDQSLCLWECKDQGKQTWEALIWDDAKYWEEPGHAKTGRKALLMWEVATTKNQDNQA